MKLNCTKYLLATLVLLSSINVANASETNSTNPQTNSSLQNAASQNTDASDNNFNRFFINGAVGIGLPNSQSTSGIGGGLSGMINFGFNFNDIYAIEAGYTTIASIPTSVASVVGVPSVSYSLYDVAFRPTLHLSQYFSFYGKVGGAIENATWSSADGLFGPTPTPSNTTSFGGLIGGGASVNFGPIGIFLEVDQFLALTGTNPSTPANLTNVSLGLQYNF